MSILGALVAGALIAQEPMLDADCSDHAAAVAPLPIGQGVNLYLRQTSDFVWVCFTAPEGSFATSDLQLETSETKTVTNLHASAQLGEWDPNDDSSLLKAPTDDRWWKTWGWTGTTNRFRPTAAPEGIEFLPASGREFQISKRRFGTGDWKLKLEIRGLKNAEGTKGRLRWPADGSSYNYHVE